MTDNPANKPVSKRRKPLGQPLDLTPEQLDELAQVTEADIAEAKAWWEANAPAKYRKLLDAKPEEGEDAS